MPAILSETILDRLAGRMPRHRARRSAAPARGKSPAPARRSRRLAGAGVTPPTEGTGVVGAFGKFPRARQAWEELRHRGFEAGHIVVVMRYKGLPLPLSPDTVSRYPEREWSDAEFRASPVSVAVRAGERAGEACDVLSRHGAVRVETRNPAAPATPM